MRYQIKNQLAFSASAVCLFATAASLVHAADDCGHKTIQHACTGNQTRIRMDIQENVAVNEIKGSASPVTLALLFTDLRDNPTCTRSGETVTWNHSYTNDYKVSAAHTTGVGIEVSVGTPQWSPIAVEAKAKAESSITLTGELSRSQTFSVGGSSTFSIRCEWHKVEVFHRVRKGTATQDFATKVWCSAGNPPNNDAVWNECNRKTITAVCNGTSDTEVKHTGGSYNCDCPPEQGDM
ncbi:MAG: hypothetical protein Q8L55_12500 [Phycisphaerales bacterium]|nr:hypothetical protein [Phycisphaerales bacterium]